MDFQRRHWKEGIPLSKALTYSLLFLVMFFWGLNVIAIKILVANFPPVMITSLRILFAGLIVLAVLVFQKNLRALSTKEWMYTALGGLLGMVANQSLLAVGLEQVTASNAALILALVPLTTSILAMIFLGDRLTLLRLIGIGFGLTGISFVILEGSGGIGGISVGAFYVFGAMFSQASSFIWINKATETLEPRQATAVMLTMGAVILFVISLFLEPAGTAKLDQGSLGVWLVFLLSAVLATALGQNLYNMAIHRLGAGQTAIFINLIPFFSLIGAVLFLGEDIVLPQILGFVFIVAGVLFGTGYMDERLKKLRNRSQAVKREV
ncbi:MAG TPA: DMT family transporter [Bacillales bacterium]